MRREDEYTNFGFLDGLRDMNIISKRLDTWYFDEEEAIGHLGLGERPLGGVRIAGYLSTCISAFSVSFAGFVRVRPHLWIAYRPSLPGVAGGMFGVEGASLPMVLARFEEQVASLPYVVSVNVRFDVRLVLRDAAGELGDEWLHNVGSLMLAVRLPQEGMQRAANYSTGPWMAHIELMVASLFRRDNSEALRQVRERWQQLRAERPDATWDDASELVAPLVVTLANPPPGTPPSNEELSQANLPRLLAAIANWENMIGQPFIWTAQLG